METKHRPSLFPEERGGGCASLGVLLFASTGGQAVRSTGLERSGGHLSSESDCAVHARLTDDSALRGRHA